MIYNWYKIFNLTEYMSTGLVSRELIVLLQDIGRVTLLISRGNYVSVTYDGVNLPINYPSKNPYTAEGYAIYLDANSNVWLGFEVTP